VDEADDRDDTEHSEQRAPVAVEEASLGL